MANSIKVVVFALIVSSSFVLSGCERLCSNEKLSEVPSPSKGYLAVIFKRDCGATTAYSYHLSIIKKGEKIKENDTGNIVSGRSEMEIKWINNMELQVTLDNKQETIKTEKQINNINIFYN